MGPNDGGSGAHGGVAVTRVEMGSKGQGTEQSEVVECRKISQRDARYR